MKKKGFKLIIFYLVFVITGLAGHFINDFFSAKKALEMSLKWCGIGVAGFALYYAYLSTFGYDQFVPVWRNVIGLITLSAVVFMVSLVSVQGILIELNCIIGNQKDYRLTGVVTKIKYPDKKKIGNNYTLDIARRVERDTIEMVVPTNHYKEGDKFDKMMKIGSLGLIYSDN
jgi:hypothetical protein